MKHTKLFGAMVASVLMTGCGGSSSSSGSNDEPKEPQLQSGIFTDSAVGGIAYQTETQGGVTAADGSYKFLPGETVTFSVGGLHLPPVQAKGVFTPVDFVMSTNLAQLLQSLDSDGNPDNGIEISSETATSFNADGIKLEDGDFDRKLENEVMRLKGVLNKPNMSYVSGSDAIKHLDKNEEFKADGGLITKMKAELENNASSLISDQDPSKLAYALELAGVENVDTSKDYRKTLVLEGDKVDTAASQAKIDAINALNEGGLNNQQMAQHIKVLFDDAPDYANYELMYKLTDGSFDMAFAEQNFNTVKTSAQNAETYLQAEKVKLDADEQINSEQIRQAINDLGFFQYSEIDYASVLKAITIEEGASLTADTINTAVTDKNNAIQTTVKSIAGYGLHETVSYDEFVLFADNEVDAVNTETRFGHLNDLHAQVTNFVADGAKPSKDDVKAILEGLGVKDIITGQEYAGLLLKELNIKGVNAQGDADSGYFD